MASASSTVEMEARVDELFQQSEDVLRRLDEAVASHADEAKVAVMRDSVERMVGSYTRAWPTLAAGWSSLQAEQSSLIHALSSQQERSASVVATLQYNVHHPQHGAQTRLDQVYQRERELKDKIQHADQAAHAMEMVHAIRAQLGALSALSSEAEPDAQAQAFVRLESLLTELSALDPQMSRAEFFVALRRQAEEVRERVVQRLLERFNKAVRATRVCGDQADEAKHLRPSDSLVLSVSPSTALPLARLFDSLHSLGASDRLVRALGDSLLDVFIRPLLEHVGDHPLVLAAPLFFSTRKLATGGKSLRIALSDAADDEAPSLEGNATEVILTLVDFVWQQVFSAAAPTPTSSEVATTEPGDRLASMSELARYLVPTLQPLILQHLCVASLPRSIDALVCYPQQTASKLVEFEQQALQRGLLVRDASGQAPLSLFLADLQGQFELALRSRVLNHTKYLVVNNAFDTQTFTPLSAEEQRREDAKFPSQFYSASAAHASGAQAQARALLLLNSRQIFAASTAYSISKATFAFVRMLYELYFEAKQARERVSEACFLSLSSLLRDSCHLWMAISPVFRGPGMESIIHLSFMFYNDCTFLAKHLARLHAHARMDQMKQAVSKVAGDDEAKEAAPVPATSSASALMLVDLVSPLQSLGSKYFLLHVTRHRNYLTELLDSLAQLNDLEEDAIYAQATHSLKQTLHQLAAVEKIWHQLMGSSQTQLTQAADESDSASGVSAPAPAQPRPNGWALNIGMLLEYLTSRLVGMVLEKTDISVEAASRIHHLFSLISAQYPNLDCTRTPTWSTFLQVKDILHQDQTLASLSASFISGSLNSLTPVELVSLVHALYSDSSHRQKFEAMVSSAGAGVEQQAQEQSGLRHLAANSHQAASKVTQKALSFASSTLSSIAGGLKTQPR